MKQILSSIAAAASILALAACSGGGQTRDGAPGDTSDTRPFAGIAETETVQFTGTEPFWGGEVTGGTLTYTTPEDRDGTEIAVERFAGRGGLSWNGDLDGRDFTLAVTPGECSDGMSDRSYPFVATLRIGEETRNGCAWTDANGFTMPPEDAAAGTPHIGLAGYDGIKLGEKPVTVTRYALADDGMYDGDCRIYTAPDLKDVYVIVERGDAGPYIARITVHGESTVTTDRGIGIGSTEAEVREAYGTMGESPHKYVEAPAKYLNWGPEGSAAGLRFVIGEDGRVAEIHTGLAPTLGYVEACS